MRRLAKLLARWLAKDIDISDLRLRVVELEIRVDALLEAETERQHREDMEQHRDQAIRKALRDSPWGRLVVSDAPQTCQGGVLHGCRCAACVPRRGLA